MRTSGSVLALLAALGCTVLAESGAFTPKLVWAGPEVSLLGGVSRDGRFLSYVDPATHNLAIREISSGQRRLLTQTRPASGQFAYFSAISPDSRRVAYAWFNEEGFYELRVIDMDGTHEQILFSNAEAGFVQPCAWSPDSKLVLTLFFRADNISQIALVPSAGGPPKILRSLNWVYPKRMDISPDGRFIVYDSFAGDKAADRSIFLLSADGASERRLVNSPGNYLFPLWTSAGKSIVYASDHAGTMDAWELEIENGEPRGDPRLLRRDLGRFLPMNITASGGLYFGLRTGSTDVFVTTLAATARDAKRATLRFPGKNTAPAWSADGMALAYLSRRGSENFGQESRSIVIRRFETKDERELQVQLAHIERVRWSPNGKMLLVAGSDSKGRGGLYLVDVNTAAMKPLSVEPGAPFRGFEGVWSKDGNSVYYLHPSGELRKRETVSGRESTVYRGAGLRNIAASPDGKWLAAGLSDKSLALIPAVGGEARMLPFEGLTDLEWGRELIAGRAAGLWRIPLDGAPPAKIESPGNRDPGFSLHPDGEHIALTAGDTKSEVWVLPLR